MMGEKQRETLRKRSDMNVGIILAGGVGSRVGADVPKQYLLVNGRPVISYVMERFQQNTNLDRVVIVADAEWRDYISEWADRLKMTKPMDFADAGKTRQHSIYNALNCMSDFAKQEDIVVIHDAARPLVSHEIINACIEGAVECGGAMPYIPMKDTVYLSKDGKTITQLLDRNEVVAGQAPEAFRFGEYYDVHKSITDEEIANSVGTSQLAFAHGIDVKLVHGSEENFKITEQKDLQKFEKILTGN